MARIAMRNMKLARSECPKDQETSCINAVRHRLVGMSFPCKEFATLDGNSRSTCPGNLCTAGIQKLGKLLNLGFHSCIFNNGRSFCEDSRHHKCFRHGHTLILKKKFCTLEAALCFDDI